jgi:hypothetical protein
VNINGKKMNRQEAECYLFEQWENGELPSNFTEDHSEYECAVIFTMKNGYYYFEAEL